MKTVPLLRKDNDASERMRHWRLSRGDKPTRREQSMLRICNDIRRQLRNEFVYSRIISKLTS